MEPKPIADSLSEFAGGLKRLTVWVSDLKTSRDREVLLITHSLGPCIGVVCYDPALPAGGMLHFQLPSSKNYERRAQENPCMFADTAIPLLLRKMEGLGAVRDRMIVSVFGGASMMKDDTIFKIGIQNARAARKFLWQQCVSVTHEDVGGNSSRTVSIAIATGRLKVRKDGRDSFYG